ncbi:NigD-like protein [Bacteroides sp.]|uniref:NigD-like protein n=1 Tax=Bacteroides sp. TaxID=29523 RepID=UPI002606516C|nr:NigD-like protein [Bacteroides sp.]MDD3037093.1 NigD-like protein [Bacteroides sp.]
MKKLNWILSLLLLALVPVLQSCDDNDDYYSIEDFSWDWATVHATGGGSYYLEGDRWGIIDPVTTAIPWYRPVDGKRVVAIFNPLADTKDGVEVQMKGINEVLTKEVEEMTAENEEEFGNDPILIYQGDMWLGGKFLNIIFYQNVPYSKKHRISLVQNKIKTPEVPENPETQSVDEDGYVHLELRYNTYDDVTKDWGWGRVSYNLEEFYPKEKEENAEPVMKGFKIKMNSKENGDGVIVVLDFDHPVGVPEKSKAVHTTSSMIQ